MTKKHFIAIAALIKKLKDEPGTNEYTLRYTAIGLAGVFEQANPLFDRAKFLKAAGF